MPAIVIGVAAVLWGQAVAQRLAWRALPSVTWATSCAWAFSLAMIDGWQRGFAGRLTARHEYLRQVPTINDIPEAVRTFSDRILDFQPNSWITHVSGHPPGALLTFVWLDRIGLGGGAWAGLLCLLVGSSAAAAIVVAVRALADESTARLAAPFVAVAPTAIWIAVSADGYFAGVAAWGITMLALAVRGTTRLPVLTAACAGLLLGWAHLPQLRDRPDGAARRRGAARPPGLRAPRCGLSFPPCWTALSVVGVFALAGFWWFDGYHLVQQRYWQGIALNRPFQYWSWANLAAVVCAMGWAPWRASAGRSTSPRSSGARACTWWCWPHCWRSLCADLSMLSKAETERIWLPFTVWLTAAGSAAAAALTPLVAGRSTSSAPWC